MPADEEHYYDDVYRFDVELFICHPSLTPAEITAALGLEGHTAHRVGAPRTTPNGRPLPGYYPDTRWRHSIRYELRDQWFGFAEKVAMLVDRLLPHKEFLHHVRATGGRATVILQFLSDSHFSDAMPLDALAKMVELQLDFGIERY
jgi:hypothetical protein